MVNYIIPIRGVPVKRIDLLSLFSLTPPPSLPTIYGAIFFKSLHGIFFIISGASKGRVTRTVVSIFTRSMAVGPNGRHGENVRQAVVLASVTENDVATIQGKSYQITPFHICESFIAEASKHQIFKLLWQPFRSFSGN